MLACIMDTLRQFSSFGFHVSLLIVDGASSNLSMLKLLMGTSGTFGYDDCLEDKHEIKPCLRNPFNGKTIHLLICPSHQVKYMHISHGRFLELFLVFMYMYS